MENSPPCFQKERNKGGILHNDVLFGQNFDYFSYCFGPLGAKNFRLRRHFHCFSCFCIDCRIYRLGMSCQGYFWKTTTSKRELSAPMKLVQNTSEKQ